MSGRRGKDGSDEEQLKRDKKEEGIINTSDTVCVCVCHSSALTFCRSPMIPVWRDSADSLGCSGLWVMRHGFTPCLVCVCEKVAGGGVGVVSVSFCVVS